MSDLATLAEVAYRLEQDARTRCPADALAGLRRAVAVVLEMQNENAGDGRINEGHIA